jgi:hypothetical protein
MRIHYQMVMGNQQRAPYDYCMVLCGPLPFDDITAVGGGVARFGADGALLDAGRGKAVSATPSPASPPPASVSAA